jgi:dGTPase
VTITRDDRRHPGDSPPDQRTASQRDRDRILYAPALRRLSGITQVIGPDEQPELHTRLTHTLEVAQIGRRLAEHLTNNSALNDLVSAAGGIDPDVVEAAALAHDLGHPPFGHIAEAELDRLARSKDVLDGFNGNAQSFRIVTKLAVRHESIPGLNLTRATLNAILKYPWFRETDGARQQKWGAYHSEQADFEWARALSTPDTKQQSIEASIMDWADDIAYAIHDVEDFFRAGFIPLDRLVHDRSEVDRFLKAAAKRLGEDSGSEQQHRLEAAFGSVIGLFPITQPYSGSYQDQATLKSFASKLIRGYVMATALTQDDHEFIRLSIDQQSVDEVTILKQLTWHYVIDRSLLATQQFGQQTVIRRLFEILHENSSPERGFKLFPQAFREQLEICSNDAERTRIVIDYIASLTEHRAISLYHQLVGTSFGQPITRAIP